MTLVSGTRKQRSQEADWHYKQSQMYAGMVPYRCFNNLRFYVVDVKLNRFLQDARYVSIKQKFMQGHLLLLQKLAKQEHVARDIIVFDPVLLDNKFLSIQDRARLAATCHFMQYAFAFQIADHTFEKMPAIPKDSTIAQISEYTSQRGEILGNCYSSATLRIAEAKMLELDKRSPIVSTRIMLLVDYFKKAFKQEADRQQTDY